MCVGAAACSIPEVNRSFPKDKLLSKFELPRLGSGRCIPSAPEIKALECPHSCWYTQRPPKCHCYHRRPSKEPALPQSQARGSRGLLSTCGSWELGGAPPPPEPRLSGRGLRTHWSRGRRAGRSAAQGSGPGREAGPPGRIRGRGGKGGMRTGGLGRPQLAIEAVLAAAAEEPAGLGAAPGPGASSPLRARSPAARPAPPAARRRSINNHNPPAHPPLKINNSVIRVISEAS